MCTHIHTWGTYTLDVCVCVCVHVCTCRTLPFEVLPLDIKRLPYCSLINLVLYICVFYRMMFEFHIHECFIICVWMGICWWFYACILLLEWFYMYIPAYVLSQAWLDKTVETWKPVKWISFLKKWSKINIWNVFSTHERVFLWKCQTFALSNHLSYQGRTFTVPCFVALVV